MIETILRDFLKDRLKLSVTLEYPQDIEGDSFVVIEKLGSGRSNYLDRASFAIKSYGSSMYEAALLNAKVKEAMNFLANDRRIGSVKLDSDYNFTDESMKKYRYQAVYDIYYYDN